MQEYIIDVMAIEELQMTHNTDALDVIFQRAKSTIVNGEQVQLIRKQNMGVTPVNEFTTLQDLENYRQSVYTYL
ncbi:MAG: hypothetical protein C4329_05770 [Chitinophagaceae bacterium]